VVAGKLPAQGATFVIVALAVFVGVAMFCCRPCSKDLAAWLRTFLCALDIVLPSFVDIGALSAWTNYSDASKPKGAVELEGWHRTMAFVMRIFGTIAFTYLLLYVTNIRG
jgi:sugar/nucleoside kinase (ribokinase family)